MSKIPTITVGTLLVGLAAASTWLLCSADVLHRASISFLH